MMSSAGRRGSVRSTSSSHHHSHHSQRRRNSLSGTSTRSSVTSGGAGHHHGRQHRGSKVATEDDMRVSRRSVSGSARAPELMCGVKVDVYLRVRPMSRSEMRTESGSTEIVSASPKDSAVFFTNTVGTRKFRDKYSFEGVFAPDTTQADVYTKAVRPMALDVSQGLTCACFAYGETGTGKTYTMEGVDNSVQRGMIPRVVDDLFAIMGSKEGVDRFSVSVSMVEIYNESLEDLFVPTTPDDRLRLMEDTKRGGTFCRNLYEVSVKSPAQIADLLKFAADRVKRAETTLNKASSRAHHVFILTNEFVDADGMKKVGRLTMVDLAGSESSSTSTAASAGGKLDARARETKAINQSLLTFGRVIQALAQKHPRIPYRDSKLTRLVSEALGGYCNTTLIACVSPSGSSEEETQCTIRYAQLARRILNKPQVNIALLLQREIEVLKAEHARELETERQKTAAVNHKLSTVRVMRDMLLEAHQSTEISLTKETGQMQAVVNAAMGDVDELHAHIDTRHKLAVMNKQAVDAFSEEVAKQAADVRNRVEDFGRDSTKRAAGLTASIDTFAELRAEEMQALSTDVQALSDVLLESHEADLERAKEFSHAVQTKVDDAQEETLATQTRVTAASEDAKAGLKTTVEDLAARLRGLEEKLFEWRMEMRTAVEDQEKAATAFVDALATDVTDLSTFVAHEAGEAQSELQTLRIALSSYVSAEQAAARSSNASLVSAIADLVQKHTAETSARQEKAVSKFQAHVDAVQSGVRAVEDGIADRASGLTAASEKHLVEVHGVATKVKETSDHLYNRVTKAMQGVQSSAAETEDKAKAGLDSLSGMLHGQSTQCLDALSSVVDLSSKFTTSCHLAVDSANVDVATAAGAVVRDAGNRSTKYSTACSSLKAAVTTGEEASASFQAKSAQQLDYLFKASDSFRHRDYIAEPEDAPVHRKEYAFPESLSATPAYSEILTDFGKEWRKEIHHQKAQMKGGIAGFAGGGGGGAGGSAVGSAVGSVGGMSIPPPVLAQHGDVESKSSEGDIAVNHRSMMSRPSFSNNSTTGSGSVRGSTHRSHRGPGSVRSVTTTGSDASRRSRSQGATSRRSGSSASRSRRGRSSERPRPSSASKPPPPPPKAPTTAREVNPPVMRQPELVAPVAVKDTTHNHHTNHHQNGGGLESMVMTLNTGWSDDEEEEEDDREELHGEEDLHSGIEGDHSEGDEEEEEEDDEEDEEEDDEEYL